jgi:phosphatidylglycerol lysyltransferase
MQWVGIGFKLVKRIVNLSKFHLKGKSNQSLRTAINRLIKLDIVLLFMNTPNSAELIAKLKPVSDEWLKQKNSSEKAVFSVRISIRLAGKHKIAVVYDANDRIVAF